MAKLEATYTYTDEELLALTREKIAKISAGAQEYYIASERIRNAELKNLWDQVRELESRIAAATAGSTTNLGSYRRDP